MWSSSRSRIFVSNPCALRAWLAALIILGGSILPGRQAAAEAWLFQPQVFVGGDWESNPRRRSDSRDAESALGVRLDARLPLSVSTQRTSLNVIPHLVRHRYRKEENKDLERDDNYLMGSVSHATYRSNTGASFGYSYLGVLTSEFAPGGTGIQGT